MLNKETINKITESWTNRVIGKYKNEFKQFFIKLKNQFKYNADLKDIARVYINSGTLTKEQSATLKEIISDNLKMLGLGGIVMLPAGTILMMVLLKSAKKLGIDLLPSKFVDEEQIQEMSKTESELNVLFKEINKECFNSELSLIPIKIKNLKNAAGVFKYSYPRNDRSNIQNPHIVISSLYNMDDAKVKNTLAHEMIHYYVAINYPNEKEHHGPNFIRIMKSINNNGLGYNITIKDDDPGEVNTAKVTVNKKYYLLVADYKGSNMFILTLPKNYDKDKLNYYDFGGIEFKLYETTSPHIKAMTKTTKMKPKRAINTGDKTINAIIDDDKTKLIDSFTQ